MTNYRKIILDASAFIALISQEPGAQVIESVMDNSIMSALNASEVVKFLIDKKGYLIDEAKGILNQLIGEIIPFTAEQAYHAAELYLANKEYGLSLADRACLALSLVTGAPIYTADKIWSKVQGFHIILIR